MNHHYKHHLPTVYLPTVILKNLTRWWAKKAAMIPITVNFIPFLVQFDDSLPGYIDPESRIFSWSAPTTRDCFLTVITCSRKGWIQISIISGTVGICFFEYWISNRNWFTVALYIKRSTINSGKSNRRLEEWWFAFIFNNSWFRIE